MNQEIWSLRNLGFTADPIATGATSQLNDPAAADPLAGYDVVFNTAAWPAASHQATVRARLQAFFAGGGGYIGALANGSNFLSSAGRGIDAAASSAGTTRAVPTARSSGRTRRRTPRSWTRRHGSRPSRPR